MPNVMIVVPRAGKKYAYRAYLPKRIKSPHNVAVRRAVEKISQSLTTSPKCTLVFFTKKGGGLKAVQRCANRHLSTGAKRRWTKMRGHSVCRCNQASCGKTKRGKKVTKGMFRPCKR
jgi:hypothetical protein